MIDFMLLISGKENYFRQVEGYYGGIMQMQMRFIINRNPRKLNLIFQRIEGVELWVHQEMSCITNQADDQQLNRKFETSTLVCDVS